MKKARYFIPALLYYLLVFALSSRSYSLPISAPGLDKIAHFFEFALLGFLLSFGYFNAFFFSRVVKSVLVFLTGLPLGLLDEFHQRFVPGRSSALSDVLADAAGIIAGILAYLYLAQKIRSKLKDKSP